jgi:hypothetical protein
MTVTAPPVLPLRAGWPLTGILLLYPLWWVLGLGVLIFPLAALPMAVILVRQRRAGRRLAVPPGFACWLLFLVVVVVSIGALGEDPPGTVPGSAAGRLIPVAFRLVGYAALTVLLLYAGNLTEEELPRRRLVRLLGWLFLVTVAGGLLGVSAGRFAFASPIELLLPHHMRSNAFVQSLVHPAAAQLMDVLGHQSPRPAAPWGYTNTWGNDFCLLVGWFAVAVFGYATGRRARLFAVGVLAVALVPVVYSLNRGLWIGLAVMAAAVALRLAVRGRPRAIGAVALVAAALAATLATTPLGTVVSQRLDHGKSNGVRGYLTDKAVSGAIESPIVGYGSTRTTLGGRQSIAVGESPDCPRCGNFTIGGNGQLWQLLYAHGIAGTACYLAFFGYGLWRFRYDATPIGLAGGAALLSTFVAMLWYNALVTPLAFTMLGYALLWRNAEAAGVARRGVAWTEERSDEGRRRTEAPRAAMAAAS